jgi:hypothetical protein
VKKVLSTLAILTLVSALPVSGQAANMSFFITSAGAGYGADLDGLSGADMHCQDLAYTAGHGDKVWRAYLSTVARDGRPAVHARDRIGGGPWYNYNGVLIARDVTELHSEGVNINKESALTERGTVVNGRGDTPNQHDILTGSNADGTVYTGEGHTACNNWTSAGSEGSARVGHFDRTGGGENPTSWNSAHSSRGCSQENLVATGGNGYFYCFALSSGGGQPGDGQDD